MNNSDIKATRVLVLAALGATLGLAALSLPGCSKTTYTYRCRDGFASAASSDAEALAGCGTHGGSLSTKPEVSRSSSRSSGRSFFSSSRRSSSRRSRRR